MQLCLDRRIAVRLDDSRSKVSVAIGRDNEAEVHESTQEKLVVFEAINHIVEGDGALDGGFALVIS